MKFFSIALATVALYAAPFAGAQDQNQGQDQYQGSNQNQNQNQFNSPQNQYPDGGTIDPNQRGPNNNNANSFQQPYPAQEMQNAAPDNGPPQMQPAQDVPAQPNMPVDQN